MVTVAVVSWNTRGLLERCLRSLAPEQDSGLADVWVVDNASSDGSADLVERQFGWARLVRADENLGFGRAVNLVAERTGSDWLAVANADTAVEPGALRTLLDTGHAQSAAGAIAPRLVLPSGATQHSVYPFPTLRFTTFFNLGAHRLSGALADRLCLEGHWDSDRPRRVPWAVGAFLLVRRAAFDAVGGFDPRLWLYAEDLDLGWRLARAGWTTLYEPRARVLHVHGAAAEQTFGADQADAWMRATYAWLALRRGRAVALATGALNVIGAAVRYVGLGLAAKAGARRFAPGRDRSRRWLRAHVNGLAAAGRSEAP